MGVMDNIGGAAGGDWAKQAADAQAMADQIMKDSGYGANTAEAVGNTGAMATDQAALMAQADEQNRILAIGEKAKITIKGKTDLGKKVAGNDTYLLELEVTPDGGKAYTVKKEEIIPPQVISGYADGTTHGRAHRPGRQEQGGLRRQAVQVGRRQTWESSTTWGASTTPPRATSGRAWSTGSSRRPTPPKPRKAMRTAGVPQGVNGQSFNPFENMQGMAAATRGTGTITKLVDTKEKFQEASIYDVTFNVVSDSQPAVRGRAPADDLGRGDRQLAGRQDAARAIRSGESDPGDDRVVPLAQRARLSTIVIRAPWRS